MCGVDNEQRKRFEAAAADYDTLQPSDLSFEDPASAQRSHPSVTVAFQAQSYSGPIPLPEHLAEYDRIVPGAARAIFEEFQANGRHSREIESAGLSGMMRKDTRAQWIATSLVLVGFGLVYELAMKGFETAAIAVAAGLLGTVVTAFLTGSIDLATRFRTKEPS